MPRAVRMYAYVPAKQTSKGSSRQATRGPNLVLRLWQCQHLSDCPTSTIHTVQHPQPSLPRLAPHAMVVGMQAQDKRPECGRRTCPNLKYSQIASGNTSLNHHSHTATQCSHPQAPPQSPIPANPYPHPGHPGPRCQHPMLQALQQPYRHALRYVLGM